MIGQVLDGYKIVDILGRGGMGIVYKAEDQELRRHVALKMIDPALAKDDTFVLRFRREAQALARIDSRHIVGVHALRRTEQGLFIVMEYVDGGTVGDLIETDPLSIDAAIPIIDQMLMAFEAAHSVGIVHRDIKPGNVMLTSSGTVKVTDFGLAKRYREGEVTQATVTQGIAGTLYYMSPEQVQGSKDLDHRSDIFSIGVTLYRMLAGRLPIEKGSGEFSVMRDIVETEWPPPSTYNPRLTKAVDAFVMRALVKEPEGRYQSAREMREALKQIQSGGEVPHRDAKSDDDHPTPRPKWLVATLSLVGIALIATAVALFVIRDGGGANGGTDIIETTGTIRLADLPADAAVLINGQAMQPGEAWETEAGPATVVVEKEGFLPWTQRVQVEAGETISFLVSLEPVAQQLPDDHDENPIETVTTTNPTPTTGTIRLQGVPAGANVRINDQPVNAGADITWRTGGATVVVELAGFERWSQTIQVPGGQLYPLQVNLIPEETENIEAQTVAVTLSPTSGGSAVIAGGTPVRSRSTVQVPPGRHQVTFRDPTYGEWTTSVDVSSARTLTAYFEREVQVGLDSPDGGSMFAALWIDGESAGTAPAVLTLGRGIHTINITKADYEVLDPQQQIQIDPSLQKPEPMRVVFRMQRQ